MSISLITPRNGSRSGSALARNMGISKLRGATLDRFVGSKDDFIINWGNSEPPENVLKGTILNKPEAIKTAVNKLSALNAMANAGVSVPQFTDSEAMALRWVERGFKAVARHTLTGSGGDGIEILSNLDNFPCAAPLYTKYIPKKSEYRVHVLNGHAFDMQRKMRRKDVADDKVNWQVRNHNNGFIFGRGDGDEEPVGPEIYELLCQQSALAVKALGLDFGAVDLIWNEKQQRVYVLEVNTAPGLEGTTLHNYSRVFTDYFWNIRHMGARVKVAVSKKKMTFNDLAQAFARNAAVMEARHPEFQIRNADEF